jgi:hypothetical protein
VSSNWTARSVMSDDAEWLIGLLARVISFGTPPIRNGRLMRCLSTSYTNILLSYLVDFKEWSPPTPSDIDPKYEDWGLVELIDY